MNFFISFGLSSLASLLFLSVIVPEDVDPVMWDKATELCQNNEGVKKLEPEKQWSKSKYSVSVVCNNGAKFYKTYKR